MVLIYHSKLFLCPRFISHWKNWGIVVVVVMPTEIPPPQLMSHPSKYFIIIIFESVFHAKESMDRHTIVDFYGPIKAHIN